jgi:arginyl-tRNA synthetase
MRAGARARRGGARRRPTPRWRRDARVARAVAAPRSPRARLTRHASRAHRSVRTRREHTRLQHVQFGLVCGDDGKRFRTRSGEVVRLVDLLDEAKVRMVSKFRERQAAAEAAAEAGAADGADDSEAFACTSQLDEAALEHAAEVMGYAAVKYADLKSNRLSNYIFNYERMLSTNGNTAVYLLYAHARICSIIDKVRCGKRSAA